MKNKYQQELRKLLSFYKEMLKKHSFPEAAGIKTFVEDDRDERAVTVVFRYTTLQHDHTSLEDCQEGVRFFRAIAKEKKSFLTKIRLKVKLVKTTPSKLDSFEAEERECLVPKHAFSSPLVKERAGLVKRLEALEKIDDVTGRACEVFSKHGILYSLGELKRLLGIPALYGRVKAGTLRRDINRFERHALKEVGLNGSSYNLI